MTRLQIRYENYVLNLYFGYLTHIIYNNNQYHVLLEELDREREDIVKQVISPILDEVNKTETLYVNFCIAWILLRINHNDTL